LSNARRVIYIIARTCSIFIRWRWCSLCTRSTLSGGHLHHQLPCLQQSRANQSLLSKKAAHYNLYSLYWIQS